MHSAIAYNMISAVADRRIIQHLIQEVQLPQRNSASAAHMEGRG